MDDDEYDDDELPPIGVRSLTKENQYVMPSADVIASQRAHEEECEEGLRQLRSEYERESKVHHDSGSSDGEGHLAAAIESMKVQFDVVSAKLDAANLLQTLIASAAGWDVKFLKDYLKVLQKEDVATIRHVTDDIMSSIEDVVKESLLTGNILNEEELKVVSLWLCAASLWDSPRVMSARRCLHVLLGYVTDQQLESWCGVLSKSLDSVTLVRASDVTAGPTPAACAASASLLRAALHNFAPTYNLDRGHGKLSVAEVCEALGGVWRTLTHAQQYTATQVAGRALTDANMAEAPAVTVKGKASRTSAVSAAPVAAQRSEADSDAITRLLKMMATQIQQHRCRQMTYEQNRLMVLMAVAKLQNLLKNYEMAEHRK